LEKITRELAESEAYHKYAEQINYYEKGGAYCACQQSDELRKLSNARAAAANEHFEARVNHLDAILRALEQSFACTVIIMYGLY
jgi:hypothetical protein